MAERIQPGGRVDKEIYEQFRSFVQRHHGQVRGALGEELENAMQERMNGVERGDRLTRIEEDVATIKGILAESDGGQNPPDSTPVPDLRSEKTHARAESADREKPAPNQPREAKVRYLRARINDTYDGLISRPDLRNEIDQSFGFREDTIQEYVPLLIDALDAEVDPLCPDQLVAWGRRLQKRREKARTDAWDEAADVFDTLDDADVTHR